MTETILELRDGLGTAVKLEAMTPLEFKKEFINCLLFQI
jgi:hypothetical protein